MTAEGTDRHTEDRNVVGVADVDVDVEGHHTTMTGTATAIISEADRHQAHHHPREDRTIADHHHDRAKTADRMAACLKGRELPVRLR